MSNENTAEVRLKGSSSEAVAAMKKAEDAVVGGFDRMSRSMTDINGLFTKVQGAFVTLTAVFAGGAAFAKLAGESAKMTEEAMDLGRALDVSTNEARVLQATMDDLGSSTAELEGAAKGLSRNLRENEANMNKLGLVTRDAAGNLRPMNELLLDGIAVLNGYKAGADRSIVSQQIFGRGVDASSKLLLLNREALEENRKAVEDLGLQTGANAVAAWQAFDAATDRAHLGMKGMVKAIGDSVMPVMTDLIRLFNEAMPAAITVVRGALSGLTSAFLFVKNGVVVLWETVNAFVISVAEPIRAVTEAMGRAMVGDFQGAAAVLRGIAPTVSGAWDTAMQRMMESSEKTARQVAALFLPDSAPGDAGGSKGTKSAPPPSSKSPVEKDERMAGWEAALAARRDVLERQSALEGTFHEFGKADEAKYWKDILDSLSAGDEKRSAVERKYYGAAAAVRKDAFASELADLNVQRENLRENYAEREKVAGASYDKIAAAYGAESKEAKRAFGEILQERRSLADQTDKIDEAAAETRHQIQLLELETERRTAQTAADLASASAQEKLQIEQRFLDQRAELERADIQRRLATIDQSNDPAAYAALKNRLLQIDAQYQARRTEIGDEGMRADAASRMQFQSGMEAGFASVIQNFAKGTMTISSFFANMGKAVLDSMIGVFAQMGARWLATQIMMIAGQAKASTAIVGIKSAEATVVVAENAAEAATGAAASQASIPYVGPILALAAMAAIFAAVSGMRKSGSTSVPSAAGGFDIPAGMNPLTQLHEREMVLPAKQADVIRGMADAQTSGQGGGNVDVSIKAHPMPGNYFMVHQTELVAALKAAQRNNAWKPA